MDKRVYIWGAGNFGRKIYKILGEAAVDVFGFIDNKRGIKKVTVETEEVFVFLPDEVVNIEDAIIYLAINNYYAMGDVVAQLHSLGVKGLFIVDPKVFTGINNRLKNLEEEKSIYWLDISVKAAIAKLEFHVIDVCNLNCRGCSHFAPEFDVSGKVTLEDFKCQMELVSKKIANVFRFRLMGGEPFIHEDIGEFALMARMFLPYTHLEIVTNGLLLDKVTDLNWDKIRSAGATLNISFYPPTFEIREQIAELLDNKRINYSFGTGLKQYNDTGMIEEFHKCFTLNNTHCGEKAIKQCVGYYCQYLRDGKISKCALPQLVDVLNRKYGTSFIVEKDDVVDLRNVDEPWGAVEMLRRATPFCGYCIDGGSMQRFKWDNQGDYVLEDYIMEEM